MQQELQRQQVDDFRIWEGIRDPECPQRGISKAHKQIIAWAAAQGHPQVLIAEDDVLFSAAGALNYFLANVPPDFDLYLGGVLFGAMLNQRTWSMSSRDLRFTSLTNGSTLP